MNHKEVKKRISEAAELSQSETNQDRVEAILDSLLHVPDLSSGSLNDILGLYLLLNRFEKSRKVFELARARGLKPSFDWDLEEIGELEKKFNQLVSPEPISTVPSEKSGQVVVEKVSFWGKRGHGLRHLRWNRTKRVIASPQVLTVEKRFGVDVIPWQQITRCDLTSSWESNKGGGYWERKLHIQAQDKSYRFDLSGQGTLPDTLYGEFVGGHRLLKAVQSHVKVNNIGDPRRKIFGIPLDEFLILVGCLLLCLLLLVGKCASRGG